MDTALSAIIPLHVNTPMHRVSPQGTADSVAGFDDLLKQKGRAKFDKVCSHV